MTTTLNQSHSQARRAWSGAIVKVASEFAPTALPVLSGKVPEGLRGTLYRNGPGRLERGGQSVGHWFDGDGAILAVHFTDAEPIALYRYIQTEGYQAEEKADRFLYSNYGMKPPGAIWDYWFRAITNNVPVKNTANTSVIALPDKLLALWEGGLPHALDLEQLQTKGADQLGGLDGDQPYSAHPKRDPHTGEIYNMGVKAGAMPKLNLYKSDRTGRVIQTGEISLDGVPLIHSFVLAGQYLVFIIPPVRVNVLPVLLGVSSYSESLEWQPDKGTQIIVVDRDSLTEVSRGEAEPWFQWHFGNGCVNADGEIVLDFARHPNFSHTNQYLREVATGKTHTTSPSQLWQLRIDPKTARVKQLQPVVSQNCEFPVVIPAQIGQPWRYTYLAMHRDGSDISQEIFGAIARFDYETGNLTIADCGENRYPMEPIYAADQQNPEQGWVLTVVYDGNTDRSEVWIYDSDRLNEEPVCRLGLPQVIPMGFHGTWRSA
jgi:all-trans-8'-apo-beta-carotenal 15,15'-oxygenase